MMINMVIKKELIIIFYKNYLIIKKLIIYIYQNFK